MKAISVLIFMAIGASLLAQSQPQGKWLNTTNDTGNFLYYGSGDKNKPLIIEDYEVLATHEICASVYGYFLEKSQLGRYNVNFKGMRTSATFEFTTQYDAEKWVEKFCTARSLTDIKAGHGELARKY